MKEEKRITKDYEQLQRIKRKKTKRKLLKKVRDILEESSSEDRTYKKKKSKDSSSESSKKPTRKVKVKMVRVTGGSRVNERRVLAELEEEENPITPRTPSPVQVTGPPRSLRTIAEQEIRERVEEEDDRTTLSFGSEILIQSEQPDVPFRDGSEQE